MALLLDTCAIIWVFENAPIDEHARRAIQTAEKGGELFVSPVSAWEIGLLSLPRGPRPAKVTFRPNASTFARHVFAWPGIQTAPLTAEIAFEACYLPGDFHRDPADRFLVATARALDIPIVTRDEMIEAYAKAGHVKFISC